MVKKKRKSVFEGSDTPGRKRKYTEKEERGYQNMLKKMKKNRAMKRTGASSTKKAGTKNRKSM